MSWNLAHVSNTSMTDTDPALQWILTSFLQTRILDSSQKLSIHFVIPLTPHRGCSSSVLECVSNFRRVFLLSSDDPGPWDPVSVEPSFWPRTLQDLEEPETFDAEAAHVSTSHNRAVKMLTRRLWQWTLKEQGLQSHKHASRRSRNQYNEIQFLWQAKPITITTRSAPTTWRKVVRDIKK